MFDFFFKPNDLSQSVNYQFSCNYFWKCFFGTSVKVSEFYKQEIPARIFYITALKLMIRHTGLKVSEEYVELPLHFVKNESCKGMVLELPDAKSECECNFVAILEGSDGTRKYYTSEYYQSAKYFGLCEWKYDMNHVAYNTKTNTLQEFVAAIGCQLDD